MRKENYEDTNAIRIGNRIRSIRKYRNMSVIELAEKVGVDADRIRKYENGQRKAKDDMLSLIADALDVSEYALLDPVTNNEIGIMYALFEIKRKYGLELINIDDKYNIVIEDKNSLNLPKYLKEWCKLLENGNDEEVTEWELHFPDNIETVDDKERKKIELKTQLEKIKRELELLDEE